MANAAPLTTPGAKTAAAVRPTTYPPGGPNDPGYAPAEQGPPTTCATTTANSELHYLYSFEPRCTPNAHDPGGAAGMSVDKAWSTYTTGDRRTVIAYVEAGVNWFYPGARDLVNQTYVNAGELPPPEDAAGHTHSDAPLHGYDLNGDGFVNVQDYAHDPRVHDANHNGYLDPEDLIAAFSTWCNKGGSWHEDAAGCRDYDSDHNGFAHDISGWDFYDHQNDPATYDSTYDHSDGQMLRAAAEGNNGYGGVGVCPGCMVMPVKAGAEALDRTDDLAQAWLYACRSGATVIISVTADLGYSKYMDQAIRYCWDKGVLMVEASNDFDSLDHQGGMFHPFVLPGNGMVPNTYDFDIANPGGATSLAVNAATTTFNTRADETSWGTHNMFTAATQGGSTSESTPTVGGAFALLLAWGRQAADRGLIASPLTNDEAIGVMRATADPITDPNLPWPGSPGDWNLQYGYGRPNLYRAMHAVAAGDVPPTAWFEGPDWYALYDPTTTDSVPITGHMAAPRSSGYRWTLEYGLGPQPTDWTTIGSGAGTRAYDGTLGHLDLAKIPASFWKAPFKLSKTKSLETNDQYTVTVRVRVTDAAGRMGEDRRAIAVHHDPTLLPGFPVHVGTDGTSQPALADLAGTGRLDMVFGDADGRVHAVDPATGRELPGWPVSTRATVPDVAYPGIDPGHEPVIAPVAVGDLRHDGGLEVVATSTTGRTYAWDAGGHLLPGWPQTLDKAAVTPPIPRPKLQFTRLAHQGATASPVLVALGAGPQLDVVQAAWDGNVYAWSPDGHPVPGWPARVRADGLSPPQGMSLVNDQKVDTTPAVANLDGHGPEIVVQSQYTFTPGPGIQPGALGHVYAFHADGSPVAGWPVQVPGLIVYYGSAQEFITEGSTAPVAADVFGDGKDEVAVSEGIFSPTFLVDGTGHIRATYGPVANPLDRALRGDLDVGGLAKGNLPADAPVTFTTTGAFGHLGAGPGLAYVQPGTGGVSVAAALVFNGSGFAIKNYERAYSAATGVPVPGFPVETQGLNFLGSPVLADVDGSGAPAAVDGADSSALHASTSTGQAAGFPKFQTGWTVFSPSVGDVLADGHNDVAATTREGYLMAWATPGRPTANQEWWTYHHDERRTGRYGVDTRPPGTVRDVHWTPGDTQARFLAPGDDWYQGTVAGYRITVDGASSTVKPQGAAGTVETLAIPAGSRHVLVQPYDAAGNLGPDVDLAPATARPAPGSTVLASRLAATGSSSTLFGWALALLAAAGAMRRTILRRGTTS